MLSLYSLAENNTYFDSWESLSSAAKNEHIEKKIARIIALAMETPFYQSRVSQNKPSLSDFPILLSNDLRENLPPINNNLLTKNTNAYNVFQSGGTTGKPKTSLFTHAELEKINYANARGFYAVGLKPADSAINLWAVGSLYMTFVHIHRMLQNYGCVSFPFSNNSPDHFVLSIARNFKANCITGVGSSIMGLLKSIPESERNNYHFNKFYYGGEHIYPADRQFLKNAFGIEQVFAPGYGTVDSWYLGYQCDQCPEAVLHSHDDQVFLEVLDPDTSKPVTKGEKGILHATVFDRELTPIIRYKVGDVVEELTDPCSCGRSTPLFKLYGRGDDKLRIGYEFIDYDLIQDIISKYKGLSGAIRIEKTRNSQDQDLLTIKIEADNVDELQVADKIINHLIQLKPTLKKLINDKTAARPQVKLVKINGLPLNPKTGKLIRVVDESR